jgi:hypothetical protein
VDGRDNLERVRNVERLRDLERLRHLGLRSARYG